MIMGTLNTQSATGTGQGTAAAPAREINRHALATDAVAHHTGYGLPCAKCKTYYAADLSACPVCKTADRVVPVAAVTSTSTQRLAETSAPCVPDDATLEEERERFLREFKSQVYASHAQINVAESFRCSLED